MRTEQVITAARRMKLRSTEQLEIVTALIASLERQAAIIKAQRKRLADLNSRKGAAPPLIQRRPPTVGR